MRRIVRDFIVVVLSTWTLLATVVRRLFRGAKHPSWSFRFELVVEVIRAVMRLGHERMSIALQRQQPALPLSPGIRRRLDWARSHIAGLRAETHTPKGWSAQDPTWLHFHGGGYTMCSPATHRELLARIALKTGARCIAPDYRKAPEHPFPAPIDDCLASYQALLDDGVDPQRIVLGGDSAGGGLVLAVLQRLRDAGLPQPRTAVLLSPWVDLTATSGGTIDDNGRFDYLSGEMLVWGAGTYLNGRLPTDPEASPIFADLTGLPPLLVQSGGGEIFLDQNYRFVERARDAGVQVQHEVSDGMVHVFQIFSGFPAARSALRSIGQYVTAVMAAPAPGE